FLSAFTDLLAPLDPHAKVLIQRDYHAENLLWLPERQGAAQVGLLDFQDAVLGHPAYDLVSVMQDARRDLAPDTAPNMIRYFLDQSGHSAETFDTAYALLGAQRNLRILGVFARLCIRDGKAHYVDLIPRVWGHIQSNPSHPALAPIATLVTDTLPPPTAENLDILRSKCATYPKP
ncbi:MAG: phosphotransferase, partial [Tateyamaria sp.]